MSTLKMRYGRRVQKTTSLFLTLFLALSFRTLPAQTEIDINKVDVIPIEIETGNLQFARLNTQSDFELGLLGVFGGQGQQAIVHNDAAYLFQGHGLMVFDLSQQVLNPGKYMLTPNQEEGAQPFIQNDQLLFRSAGGDYNIFIMDIVDPLNPVLQHTIDVGGRKITNWHLSGNWAYLCRTDRYNVTQDGLSIVDLTDPAAPIFYDFPDIMAVYITISGNTMYMLDNDYNLVIYDITDPTNPQELGRHDVQYGFQILIQENHVFIAGNQIRGIDVYNISDPQNITKVTTIAWGKNYERAVIHNDKLYISSGNSGHIYIWDIADINNPVQLGEIESKVDEPHVQVVEGSTLLYVSGQSDNQDVPLQVIDATDPANPQNLMEFQSPARIRYTAVTGTTLYVSARDDRFFSDGTGGALYRYRITEADLPVFEGRFPQWAGAQRLIAEGDMLYLLDKTGGEFKIIDFSDPVNPQEIGSFTLNRTVLHEMSIRDNLAYFVEPEGFNLEVLDLTDPTTPVKIGDNYFTVKLRDVVALPSGQFIAIAYKQDDINYGYMFVDMTDPSAPVITNAFKPTRGEPYKLAISGNTLFVTGNTNNDAFITDPEGWFILAKDITDPLNSTLFGGTGEMGSSVKGMVALDANNVVLSLFDQGLAAISIEDGEFVTGNILDIADPMHLSLYTPGATGSALSKSMMDETPPSTPRIYGQEGFWPISGYGSKEYDSHYGIKVIEVAQKRVTLTMKVNPPEAKTAGCSTIPEPGDHKKDKDENVPLTAIEKPDLKWYFKDWTGASGDKSTSIKMDASKTVTANFVHPTLTLSGRKGDEPICPECDDRDYDVSIFTLEAEDDDWELKTMTFQSFGDGHEVEDIKIVYLYIDNVVVGSNFYSEDNGSITLSMGSTVIHDGESKQLRLEYVFNDEIEMEDVVKTFNVRYKCEWISAETMTYPDGVQLPPELFTSGPIIMAPVFNQQTQEGFLTIQDAINDDETKTGQDHVIEVCPGDYSENVSVSKSLTIKSIEGWDKTTLQPVNADLPVIKIGVDEVNIYGFHIKDGTTGIEMLNVSNCNIGKLAETNAKKSNAYTSSGKNKISNFIKKADDKYERVESGFGIFISGTCSDNQIYNNELVSNTNGLVIIGANNNNIANNIFAGNHHFGVYFRDSKLNIIYQNQFSHTNNPVDKNDGWGLQIWESTQNDVSHNIFFENAVGLSLTSSYENKISNNTIFNNSTGILSIFSTKSNIYENKIYENKTGGLVLSRGNEDKIFRNQIYKNPTSGIDISTSKGLEIYDNKIYENKASAVTAGIDLWNCNDINIKNNKIWKNEENGVIIKKCDNIRIEDNRISDHNDVTVPLNSKLNGKGIVVDSSKSVITRNNFLIRNCTDVYVTNSTNVIELNYVMNSLCLFTGIHVENSVVDIKNNNIIDHDGNAILCKEGTIANVHANNIYGNGGFGIQNDDATVTINATGNWWGDAAGPGNDAISGKVDVSGWLSQLINLVVGLPADTLYLDQTQSDSSNLQFNNLENPDDVIDVTLQDEMGWLQEPKTFTVTLEDTVGATIPIAFVIPANPQNNIANKVTVTAVSQNDMTHTTVDSFYVVGYLPQIASVSVFPDSVTLMSGESFRFVANGVDQHNQSMQITPLWSATGGDIDSTGLYVAGSDTGYFEITAEDPTSNLIGTAVVYIGIPTSIEEMNRSVAPSKFVLYQNYPNPFNPETTISFAVKESCRVILKIYDIMGREILTLADRDYSPGFYNAVFDARQLPSGTYFYRIQMKDFHAVKKMLLLE